MATDFAQIAKYGREPSKFNVGGLAEATEGFTGSEIEQVFIDALYAAFATGKEPTALTVSLAIQQTVPLSRLMSEQIAGLRAWAKGRARPATTVVEGVRQRKIAA